MRTTSNNVHPLRYLILSIYHLVFTILLLIYIYIYIYIVYITFCVDQLDKASDTQDIGRDGMKGLHQNNNNNIYIKYK